ncbi:MAG: HAD family hydrolase [Flavobacteriaceae bacterium]
MMQKKNLIVFDIDDTLTKSEDQHQTAYVNTMLHFGITDIDMNWKDYTHHTDSYILKENYERNKNNAFDFTFIPSFENKMTQSILSLPETKEIPGAKEIVKFFTNETDYGVCFATGSLLKPAFVKLQQAEIPFLPELVVASNTMYEREKIVKNAIDKAKYFYKVDTFENIISIGDGIWDLKTARNLGLHFLGIREKNLVDFQQENIKSHINDWMAFDFHKIKKQLEII